MEIVQCSGLSFDYGAGALLRSASFRIVSGERLGLIGANGSGKTTLARLITGELEPTAGTLPVRDGARVELVPQDYRGAGHITARELMLGPVVEIEQQMRASEHRMAETTGDALEREMRRYQSLTERYASAGGPEAESNAERSLARVGLAHRLDARMHELSGGERNLVLIAKALAGDPDLVIMDEPGNHLDLGGLDWLESIVRGLECAALIISHNRYLLDRTVSGIIEIDGAGSVSRYAGGYSQARMEKLRAAAAQGSQYQADRKKLDRLERLVARLADEARTRPDPAKGKQLRARRTQLARARDEASDAPERSATRPEIELAGFRSRSDIAVDVIDYTRSVGSRSLFEHAYLSVATGERIGIVGPNGCGKSTFLRALSGGERNRVQIARLVAEKANLLLLDEPTNHLDIPAREAVEEALADFDGTVIVVSHDRYFLDAIATSIAEITDGAFARYDGGFTQFWRERRDAFRRNGGGVDTTARARMQRTARSGASAGDRSSAATKSIEKRIISLEAQKESLEREIETLNDRREYRRARQLGTKLARLASTIDELYRRWE